MLKYEITRSVGPYWLCFSKGYTHLYQHPHISFFKFLGFCFLFFVFFCFKIKQAATVASVTCHWQWGQCFLLSALKAQGKDWNKALLELEVFFFFFLFSLLLSEYLTQILVYLLKRNKILFANGLAEKKTRTRGSFPAYSVLLAFSHLSHATGP